MLLHAQKRYVVITYNQIASDIIASTASTTVLQCSQQGSRGTVTAWLLNTEGLYVDCLLSSTVDLPSIAFNN